MAKQIDEALNSQEIEQTIHRIINRRKIEYNQLLKFHEKIDHDDRLLNDFISKVMNKYESQSYRQRWLSRGIEPQEQLYWFLLNYAEHFGYETSEKEFELYGNSFMTSLWVIGNYYIGRMDGQGSVVKVFKGPEGYLGNN